jgi:hypothetical protein
MSANHDKQPRSTATAVLCRLALFTGCGALTGFGAGVVFGPLEDFLMFMDLPDVTWQEAYDDWSRNYRRFLLDHALDGVVLGLLLGAFTAAISGLWRPFRHPVTAGLLWASLLGTVGLPWSVYAGVTHHDLRCVAAIMSLGAICGFASALAVRINDRRRIGQ